MRETEILSKLLRKNNQTFEELAQGCNRNTYRKTLTALVNKELIEEYAEPYKNGIYKHFRLSPKGRKIALENSADDSGQRWLDTITQIEETVTFFDAKNLIGGYSAKTEKLLQKLFNNEVNDQTVNEYLEQEKKLWSPILNTIYRLHVLLTKRKYPDANTNEYITVIKGGNPEPYVIPLRFLEGIDWDVLSALYLRNDIKTIHWTTETAEKVPGLRS